MAKQKFTVFLLPDEDGYQVIFPHYPGCNTWGASVQEALEMAREAIELYLEVEAQRGGEPVPGYVHASHVVVGEVEVRVPDRLAAVAVD